MVRNLKIFLDHSFGLGTCYFQVAFMGHYICVSLATVQFLFNLLLSGCPNLPVILDTTIRKAHDAAWFALSFAFLCFTSCTHLPHWLNNVYQKFFIRNVRCSQLCTFLANKHWRWWPTLCCSIWCFQADCCWCIFSRHCTLKVLTVRRMPWFIHKLPVISAPLNVQTKLRFLENQLSKGTAARLGKKPEFQLTLWTRTSQMLLALGTSKLTFFDLGGRWLVSRGICPMKSFL